MKIKILISSLLLPFTLLAQGNLQFQNNQAVNPININYFQNKNDNVGNEDNETPMQAAVNSNDNNTGGSTTEPYCEDCEKVKQALRAARNSSGSSSHRSGLGIRRWSRVASGRMHMKMKKTFSRSYKAKTSFAVCFNWH